MVRILHVTDVHCRTGTLRRIIEGESYDLVLSSGDFECLDSVETLLASPARVMATTGNMDNASIYRRLLDAGALLDGRVEEALGLRIAGIGGMDVHGSLRAVEEALGLGGVDVLVSHHPPHGVLDTPINGVHAGLFEIRSVLERFRPKMHLFGHIHEARGSASVSGILLVNSGPVAEGSYSIIDLGRGEAVAFLKRLGE